MLTEKEILKINQLGKKYKNKYENFIYSSCFYKGTELYIKIFNEKRNEQKTLKHKDLIKNKNPFSLKLGIPLSMIIENVNYWGKNRSSKKEEQFEFYSKISGHPFKVKIKNLFTNELKIVQYNSLKNPKRNPFRNKTQNSDTKIIETCLYYGQKSKNQYENYVLKKILRNYKKRDTFVKLYCFSRKEYKIVKFNTITKNNPFNVKSFKPINVIKQEINNYGRKSLNPKYHFIFVKDLGCFENPRQRSILIQNKYSGKKSICYYQRIIDGANPFDPDNYSIELKEVHPAIKKILKNNNFLYKHEYSLAKLGDKSRVDFKVFDKKGNYVLIEAKSEVTTHGKNFNNSIRQINQYHTFCLKDTKYKGIILCSLEANLYNSLDKMIHFIKMNLK